MMLVNQNPPICEPSYIDVKIITWLYRRNALLETFYRMLLTFDGFSFLDSCRGKDIKIIFGQTY